MPISDFWRTARFRQTLIYGAMFAAILAGMLGLIYIQTVGYLSRDADKILRVEATAMERVPADALPARIDEELRRDPRHISLYGLFSRDGVWITGNVRVLPAIPLDGSPRELGDKNGLPAGTQALALRLKWGEVLVLGRVASQQAEVRRIIVDALAWSGGLVVVIGLALGVALSVQPLRRIQAIREASARVAQGDLRARLPIAGRNDELDMLAGIVNAMMDEIERLVGEAKSVGDVVAHDLRTPLTRLRLLLSRLGQAPDLAEPHARMLEQALAEADTLLGRFRAILRISEIENQGRRAGFRRVDLLTIVDQAAELYGPLAEEKGLALRKLGHGSAWIQGDPDLLFEALCNLIDNAIKFTPAGGAIDLILAVAPEGPELTVIDNGPGVAAEERAAVTGRYYRSRRDQSRPGAGLGLSIVAAVAHLHGFALVLEDAEPGLRATIECWPRALHAVSPSA
jgi:signal transduction histidine kinase